MGADWVDESDCVGAWQNSGLAVRVLNPDMCLYSTQTGKTAMLLPLGIADTSVLAVTGQDGCRLG